jgi:hypothetical protein
MLREHDPSNRSTGHACAIPEVRAQIAYIHLSVHISLLHAAFASTTSAAASPLRWTSASFVPSGATVAACSAAPLSEPCTFPPLGCGAPPVAGCVPGVAFSAAAAFAASSFLNGLSPSCVCVRE